MTLMEFLELVLHPVDGTCKTFELKEGINYDSPLVSDCDEEELGARLCPDDSTGEYPNPPSYVKLFLLNGEDGKAPGGEDNWPVDDRERGFPSYAESQEATYDVSGEVHEMIFYRMQEPAGIQSDLYR